MAKETKTRVEPVEQANEPVAKPSKPEPVSVYTAADLAANHKVFGTSHEIVKVALKIAGKESATFDEAKQIIDTFKNKEVK